MSEIKEYACPECGKLTLSKHCSYKCGLEAERRKQEMSEDEFINCPKCGNSIERGHYCSACFHQEYIRQPELVPIDVESMAEMLAMLLIEYTQNTYVWSKEIVPMAQAICEHFGQPKRLTQCDCQNGEHARTVRRVHLCPRCGGTVGKEKLESFKRLGREEIVKILEGLAHKQMSAIIKTVDEKGLLKTGWDDIDNNGGSLTFELIADAIVEAMEKI